MMKKIFIGIILFAVLIPTLFFTLVFFLPTRVDRTERLLIEDYELLVAISQFLIDSPYGNVSIMLNPMSNGETTSFSLRHNVTVEDADIVVALNELENRRYRLITMRGNAVIFQRWATMHEGWGIAFSTDGNKPNYRYIVRLEPLSQPNWYFYMTTSWDRLHRHNQRN